MNDELGTLGEELGRLRGIMGPILELSTGSRPELTVKSVSSSEFAIMLDAGVKTAALLAMAVAFIIKQYKEILEIRVLRAQILEHDVPDAAEALEARATALMSEAIAELAERMIEENRSNLEGEGREFEVRTELRRSLSGLADRIDAGFHIEVRAEPPEVEAPEDEETERPPIPDEEHFDTIAENAETLQFLRIEGEPILHLTSAEEDSEPGDGATSAEQ